MADSAQVFILCLEGIKDLLEFLAPLVGAGTVHPPGSQLGSLLGAADGICLPAVPGRLSALVTRVDIAGLPGGLATRQPDTGQARPSEHDDHHPPRPGRTVHTARTQPATQSAAAADK